MSRVDAEGRVENGCLLSPAMLQHAHSPSASPVRKRQRLSSPTYDDQMGDLSQDCLDALDEIEFSLSQFQVPQQHVQKKQPLLRGPLTDPDSPFLVNPSNAPPTEQLSASQSTAAPPVVLPLFQSAKSVDVSSILHHVPPSSSFSNKENQGVLRPSEAALKAAQAKLKEWEQDWDDLELPGDEGVSAPEDPSDLDAIEMVAFDSPAREMLPPVSTPVQQSSRLGFEPSGFGSQSRSFRPLTLKSPANVPKSPSFVSPSTGSQTPLFPSSSAPMTPAGFRQPLFSNKTPRDPLWTPRSVGISNKIRSTFITPFKAHVGPSRPYAKSSMKIQLQNRIYPPAGRPSSPLVNLVEQPPTVPSIKPPVFTEMQPQPPKRKKLLTSGLRPQQYSDKELEDMGLDLHGLREVTPSSAPHYHFHSFPPDTLSAEEPTVHLNSAAAYEELKLEGRCLATKEWVDNHWSLILWKVAGMAILDPNSEQTPDTKRWCWAEVMRQLRYRYDVELDGGKRPILRRIVAHDSPANIPLILCVSAVIKVEEGCMLEVTDGWYRLRAVIDAPLVRAVKKGIIREGRKLAISGARLKSEKKDPAEILEAYNSVTLSISANSCNMAPWYARLGNQAQRYIPTLHSLTPDGGMISCLDIVILKVHPVGHIEFVKQDGFKVLVGPRNQIDEGREVDDWMKRREKEASKLQDEHDKRLLRYRDYLSRIQIKAQNCHPIGEDEDCPDQIDNYYDDLEEHKTALQRISSITPSEAYWLAQAVVRNLESEHERIRDEIEKELANLCPPRDVKNFRVLVIKDARTEKRPSNRVAQLTVWDADNFDTSSSGPFAPGQRYLVSNLVPTKHTAWMNGEPGSEIFMQTGRDSQWLKRRPVE